MMHYDLHALTLITNVLLGVHDCSCIRYDRIPQQVTEVMLPQIKPLENLKVAG